MNAILLLVLIIALYIVRSIYFRVKGQKVDFLWISFFIFCLPFEIAKALTIPVTGMFTGTLGSTFYINLSTMMICALIPFMKWDNISFKAKYNDWVTIILIFALISLLNPYNISKRGTVIFVGYFVSLIVMFKMLKSFLTKNEVIQGLFDGFMLLAFIQLFLAICFPLLGIAQVTTMFHEVAADAATRHDSNRVGAVGTFQHPGNLALFCVLSGSFFLACYLNNYRKKISFWLIIINAMTIVLTFSRTSYLAFLIVIAALIYINRNAKKNIFSLASIFKLVVPVSLVFLWLIFLSPLSASFLESDTSEQYQNRMVHFFMAYSIFQQSPILGVGLNAHLAFLSKNFSIANTFTLDNFFTENPIHNIHLIVLAETGIFGFLLWFRFIFKNIVTAKNEIAKNRNQVLSLTLIGMFCAYLFYGMTGWTPFSRGVLPLFLFITYFAVAYTADSQQIKK
jgi:O-antigen ligase